MPMLEILKKIVADKRREGAPDFVIRNFLKEYLQYPVLEFIYNGREYRNFIFTGGSCLRVCFSAPRLSEDLDFDLLEKDWEHLNMEKMARELEGYFKEKYLLLVVAKWQEEKRIYVKFPILKELGLAKEHESDQLYVKIEPSKTVFLSPTVEADPIFRAGFNFVVRRYSLPFLMTGKVNAIVSRSWFQGKDNAIDIKGRDFFDLFWYMERGVSPDFRSLQKTAGIATEAELKEKLKEKIERDVTADKLAHDLKNFFPDQAFVSDFCRNYRDIMRKYIG